jgi:FkbM family methyltransferase
MRLDKGIYVGFFNETNELTKRPFECANTASGPRVWCEMKRRVTPRGMACLLLEFVVLIWVMMHGQHSSRKLPVDSGVVPHCGVASPGHIVWVRYESEYSAYGFYISLHDSGVDSVVSRTIRNTQQYPSVGELHSVCENLRESVDCGPGKVFVEVGASIGMVSLYAASRGMRVYAFDPVLPNVQRLVESVCLNGRVYCAERSNECVNSSEWGPFSPGNFRVLWNLVGSAPKAEQPVRTEPGNLAATMRGGGGYAAEVGMVTLDQFIDVPIEVLLLTCQGFELDVSYFYLSIS